MTVAEGAETETSFLQASKAVPCPNSSKSRTFAPSSTPPKATVKAVDGITYDVSEGEDRRHRRGIGLRKVGRGDVDPASHPAPPGEILQGSRILFGGKDLLAMSDAEIRHVRGGQISMVFQEPMTSLNPVLTIGMQLTETMMLHMGLTQADADRRAVELLGLVGIGEAERRLKQYPHHFSGGMRQRVMIALALSCKPRLIIADEPTTALDVTIQAQILELMRNLTKQMGVALIVITHNLGVVARYAERVIVMYAGKIVESGTADQIYHDPASSLYHRTAELGAPDGSAPGQAPGADRGTATRPDPTRRRLLVPAALPVGGRILWPVHPRTGDRRGRPDCGVLPRQRPPAR